MNKQNAKLQEQIDSVRLHLLILRGKEDSLHMDGAFLGGKPSPPHFCRSGNARTDLATAAAIPR